MQFISQAGQIVLEPIEPPSSAFLSASLNLYFRHLHNELPFIHRPTFQPQAHNALFLLAMCASGSRFIGTTEALSFSSTVFERINLILQVRYPYYPSHTISQFRSENGLRKQAA